MESRSQPIWVFNLFLLAINMYLVSEISVDCFSLSNILMWTTELIVQINISINKHISILPDLFELICSTIDWCSLNKSGWGSPEALWYDKIMIFVSQYHWDIFLKIVQYAALSHYILAFSRQMQKMFLDTSAGLQSKLFLKKILSKWRFYSHTSSSSRLS